MAAKQKPFVTPEQYLEIERQAEVKSEYISGQMFAMVGGSEAHNLISTNVISELSAYLKGKPCRVYSSDLRVLTKHTGLYTYPDVTIACDKIEFVDDKRDTLINPMIIFEVLSPSTEAYDRGEKFAHYRSIKSLMEYVLISQDKIHVERFLRQPENQWLYSEVSGNDAVIHLESISFHMSLLEYDKVELAS